MPNVYRRLGLLCRVAHAVYGFLLAHAATINPVIAIIMFLSFVVYEFAEWIHDLISFGSPDEADWPDDEFAELGIGMAVYAALKMLHMI